MLRTFGLGGRARFEDLSFGCGWQGPLIAASSTSILGWWRYPQFHYQKPIRMPSVEEAPQEARNLLSWQGGHWKVFGGPVPTVCSTSEGAAEKVLPQGPRSITYPVTDLLFCHLSPLTPAR